MKKLLAIALAAAVATAPVVTNATVTVTPCRFSDIGGTWSVYGLIGADGSFPYWLSCDFGINKNTGVLAPSSSCIDLSGTSGLVSGKITLVSGENCVYGGSFDWEGVAFTFSGLTLSQTHDVAAAVGTFTPSGYFSFNLIRR